MRTICYECDAVSDSLPSGSECPACPEGKMFEDERHESVFENLSDLEDALTKNPERTRQVVESLAGKRIGIGALAKMISSGNKPTN